MNRTKSNSAWANVVRWAGSRRVARFSLVALAWIVTSSPRAGENLVLQVSGSFPEHHWDDGDAWASYPVNIPSRGWAHSVTVGNGPLLNGPDGNNPYYHRSSRLTKVGPTNLGNLTATPLEAPTITTELSQLLPEGGQFDAVVHGPAQYSFEWGDFLYGEAQSFTAQLYHDPSPTANAGPNQALQAGAGGQLLGLGTDPNGDALTYEWTRLFGPGLSLSASDVAQPLITAPNVTSAETTRMQLVVRDAHSASLPDTVDIVLYPAGGNIPPICEAGPDAAGAYPSNNAMNGAGSYDFDGVVKFYSWTQQAGQRVHVSDPRSAAPTFKQYEPTRSDEYFQFELFVSDGKDLSAPDTMSALVQGWRQNAVPVGPRETQIFSNPGWVPEVTAHDVSEGAGPATTEFGGIGVPGPGRLRAEVLGSPALFNGPDGNNPGFHLTSHGDRWNGAGVYDFQQTNIETAPIVANTFFDTPDGGAKTLRIIGPQALSYTFFDFLYGEAQSFTANVWFRPASQAPTANAGQDQTVESQAVFQLNGLGSTDPDGQPLSYLWSQTSGPGAAMSNTHSAVPLVKAPDVQSSPATLVFELKVQDGQFESPPDTVQVQVNPKNRPNGAPSLLGGQDSGGGFLRLVWENATAADPLQFVGFAYDIYTGLWVERGFGGTPWFLFLPAVTAGQLDLFHGGAYHAWIANQYPGGGWFPCGNPWTGVLFSGTPHTPADFAAANLGALRAHLTWRADVFGAWCHHLIAYHVESATWVSITGPNYGGVVDNAVWHFPDFPSASFINGSADYTVPFAGTYWFYMRSAGWMPPYPVGDYAGAAVVVTN